MSPVENNNSYNCVLKTRDRMSPYVGSIDYYRKVYKKKHVY